MQATCQLRSMPSAPAEWMRCCTWLPTSRLGFIKVPVSRAFALVDVGNAFAEFAAGSVGKIAIAVV